MKLYPERTSSKIYNYFCTWFHQNLVSTDGNPSNHVGEKQIFSGEQPWIKVFPEIRKELISKIFKTEDESEPAIILSLEF